MKHNILRSAISPYLVAVITMILVACDFHRDSIKVPINVPFEVTQEYVLLGEQEIRAIRVAVEAEDRIRLLLKRNGQHLDSCHEDCDEWLVASDVFEVGDHVTVDLRVGEIYRDRVCIVLT